MTKTPINQVNLLSRSPLGNLILALKLATVRPKPANITIRKEDKENEKPKNEKITTKELQK
jgi:hypothetical protein